MDVRVANTVNAKFQLLITAVSKTKHPLALECCLHLEFGCSKLTTGPRGHLLGNLFHTENKNKNWVIKKDNLILDPSSKDFSGIFDLSKRLFPVHTHSCWSMWPVTPSKWLFLSVFTAFNCALQRRLASDRAAELVSHFGVHWSLVFRHLTIGHMHLNSCRQMTELNLAHSCFQGEALAGWAYFYFRRARGFSSFSFHSEQKEQWLLGCCWMKQMCTRLGTPDWDPASKCHLWIAG